MLRNAFASALRFARHHSAVLQTDFEIGVSQSHISRLERAESSVTLERLEEIASLLKIHPLSLVALAYGANEQLAPSELLDLVRQDLSKMDALLQPIAIDDQPATHPRVIEAEKLRLEVQRLKNSGHTKAAVSRALGIARSTAARHWE